MECIGKKFLDGYRSSRRTSCKSEDVLFLLQSSTFLSDTMSLVQDLKKRLQEQHQQQQQPGTSSSVSPTRVRSALAPPTARPPPAVPVPSSLHKPSARAARSPPALPTFPKPPALPSHSPPITPSHAPPLPNSRVPSLPRSTSNRPVSSPSRSVPPPPEKPRVTSSPLHRSSISHEPDDCNDIYEVEETDHQPPSPHQPNGGTSMLNQSSYNPGSTQPLNSELRSELDAIHEDTVS